MIQFTRLLHTELRTSIRSGVEFLTPLVFFLLVTVVIALSTRATPTLALDWTATLVWISAFLAHTLSLDYLFRRDHEEGILAIVVLPGHPTYTLINAKLLAHWVLTGLPICLISPLLLLASEGSMSSAVVLLLTLMIGTATMTLVGSLGSALLVGLAKGGMLLIVILLPIYLPILLLGIGVCKLQVNGMPFNSQLYGSLAILTAALTIVPLTLGPILRYSQDS